MADALKIAELIGEDRHFQNRFWIVQRIAWALITAALTAVFLGFTGAGGPYSTRIVEQSGTVLKLPRAFRWSAEDEIILRTEQVGTSRLHISLPDTFFQIFDIEDIAPQPLAARQVGGMIQYQFAASPGAKATIIFRLRPRKLIWTYAGWVRVNGQPALPLSASILP